MSDKPTIGEWTLKGCCIQVQDGAIICVDDQAKADNLRKYHNAALAAEREVGHNQAVALGQQIIKLEDQLAAEREKRDDAELAALKKVSNLNEEIAPYDPL